MMNDFLEFSQNGYQIEKELGQNRAGGRVTYLAKNTQTGQRVVIKQFQFAKSGSSWSDYNAYDREIQVLKGLEHPGIPHYLNSFQTADGFCMVQEYKHAQSLGIPRSFNFNQVQQIAVSLLEILVYLQHRVPPVIHRDIKPENILIDDQLTVYLVDFGFAHIGDGEVGISSVVKGTLGFMPPEQLFNRQLTEASDLYGLGITLICLLTGTKSIDVGNLIDITYQVNFRHLVPKLSVSWVNWLEKMVEPRLKDRLPNAAAALVAMPAHQMRPPEVRLNQTSLSFMATKPRETLTQTITIHNPAPETQLEGTWEVASHLNDPPHTPNQHAWIKFQPAQFKGNQASCQIGIDTSQLMSGKTYHRTLLLHTNAFPSTNTLDLQVRTIPFANHARLPYGALALLFTFSLTVTWIMAQIAVGFDRVTQDTEIASFGFAVGATVGFEFAAWMLATAGATAGASAGVMAGILAGVVALGIALMASVVSIQGVMLLMAGVGFLNGAIAGLATGFTVEHLVTRGKAQSLSTAIVLLMTSVAICLGLGWVLGFSNPFLVTVLSGSSVLLAGAILYLLLTQIRSITYRRHREQHLIKP